MLEKEVEAHLVRRVRELGGECRKVQWIGRHGAPDRLVMLPKEAYVDDAHSCIWVELKRPGQKAKPHQQREHERMREMGQRVVVIDSIDAVEELLT